MGEEQKPGVSPDPIVAHLSFVFSGAGLRLPPAEISARMGLEPSQAWAKGDEHTLRDGRRVQRPWTVWRVSTEGVVNSTDLNVHAEHLLALLEPRARAVREVKTEGVRCALQLWYETTDHVGSFGMHASLVVRLSVLVDSIDFSFVSMEGARD